VAGRWRYLYRAVDQFGQVIDVMLFEQRDTAAARRFFTRALRHGPAPVEVNTDQAGPYLRVIDDLVRPQCTSPSSTPTTVPKPIMLG
jgi:transposase, IS6 family